MNTALAHSLLPRRASNRRLVTVLSSDGHLEQIESQAIEVGDVVRLVENEVVPADLVVLSTSHEHGQGRRAFGNRFSERKSKTESPLIYCATLIPKVGTAALVITT